MEALAHGSCRPYVKEFFRKDGSRVPVLVGGTILPDRRTGVFFVLDRTAQEAAEAALRTWADAFAHAAQGIAITDPESNRIRFANPAFAAMHGMSVEEIAGTPVAELYAPRERDAVDGYAATANRDGRITFESWHVRRDGSEFPVAVDVTTVRGPDGEPRYRIANVQDISERRRIEDQLRQAARMEAVGQLAGGVAHDYNNLTLVMLGYADFALRRLAADHPAAADVREIRQAAERAARLTSQLLAFSRRQVLQPTVLDPNQVVGELTKMLGRLLGEHIELALHLAPAAGHVRADRGSLEQVLVNLAVNSRDAMPRGGRLTIATGAVELSASRARELGDLRPGPHVRITVHDTGSGMDEATQARIFEPFFTTKPVGRGTGLGLAMVYGTIQQSGGGIAVTSAPGEGATFELYLPRVADDAAEEERREPPPPRGRERILLVEDDPSVRGLAARTLEDLGYAVRAAGSADEAREMVASAGGEPPELLVTDVIMPGDSGRRLAEDLRARLAELRVLFMSGYTDDAVLAHGVSRASAHFLQKPFTPDGLARKVREVLDAPAHRDERRGG
jgi:PAS domain S-box-containing protein